MHINLYGELEKRGSIFTLRLVSLNRSHGLKNCWHLSFQFTKWTDKIFESNQSKKKLYATESEKFASRCPFMLNGILLFSSQMSFFIVASIENMLPLRSVEFKFSLLGEI